MIANHPWLLSVLPFACLALSLLAIFLLNRCFGLPLQRDTIAALSIVLAGAVALWSRRARAR